MNNFLRKLKIEGKIEIIEPNTNVCESYLDKSGKCLKSARVLLESNLLENSITMSYYSMYNSLTALLFRTGIKCENHSGSILLLKVIFDETELFETISVAKKERIDKQYYVNEEKEEITIEETKEMIEKSEGFILNMKTIIERLDNSQIISIKGKIDGLTS